ncbi:MAG: helix-turn-helix transcriptional regulator [Crocinitomicaceae bacterium]|nr:helix-turn-helix transcriptional regulator [Crocinitomicaceae bacterium]
MDISNAFDKTLRKYGISGAWLSRQTGLTPSMISNFRNGKRVYTDTLQKLLIAIPVEAREYFYSLLEGRHLRPNLEVLVENLSSDDLHDLFDLIADRVVRRSKVAKVEDEIKVA